jgi:hypothetical protein
VEMGYLTVLYIGLGAKIGDPHAKNSNSFRNRLMTSTARQLRQLLTIEAIDRGQYFVDASTLL